MATRSNIAYRTPEGRIVSIYCHWDGYPAHNGEMLRRYYTTTDKIVDLISLGSISSLNKEIGKKQDFDDRSTQKDDWTLAYHRDRGEQLVINEYDDIPSWVADMEEYAYLWNGREWLVNDHGEMDQENRFPVFSRVVDVIDEKQLAQMGWDAE
jgi:hypothetical protein